MLHYVHQFYWYHQTTDYSNSTVHYNIPEVVGLSPTWVRIFPVSRKRACNLALQLPQLYYLFCWLQYTIKQLLGRSCYTVHTLNKWVNTEMDPWIHSSCDITLVCSTSFCYLYGRFFKVTDALSDGYFTQIITFLLQGRNTMELYVSTSPFVICAQIELDKTAEEFRKNHSERTELLHQWENTIEQMHKRDREMDQLAVVSTTYILYSIVDGPLAITQKYALPMRACPYRQTTQIFAKKTPWPMQYKPHQHGVVVLQWKFLVINVKLSIFILFPNYCEQCNHSNSWQQLLGCWLSTAW